MFFPAWQYDWILRALLLGPIVLVWATFVVRVVGLRSFSKMTAFDFISTIATGSLLANAASSDTWESFLQPCIAIAALLGAQALIAFIRRRSDFAKDFLENEPVILMLDGRFQRRAMRESRVTEDDIRAKLREANIQNANDVRAVILETTGDISVLHGPDLDTSLLEGVRDLERPSHE